MNTNERANETREKRKTIAREIYGDFKVGDMSEADTVHAALCTYHDWLVDTQAQPELLELLNAVESILDAGHMNTEDLARLRAAHAAV
jgi:hypothetical protein